MNIREIMRGESALAARALRELRPDAAALATPAARDHWIDEVQRAEGYRIAGSFIDGTADAVAVIGFRHQHSLLAGHYCYVEDVIALPEARQDGHAQALMEWVVNDARDAGCARVELNSGVARHAAHRFYMNARFSIAAFHFTRDTSAGK
jgi:GNAT superfamily N-acetyltransferase